MTTQKTIFLHAGDYVFSKAGIQLHTLLGSCISITLWHPVRKIGGMCHFTNVRNSKVDSTNLNGRYAQDCMYLFCRSIQRTGLPIEEFEGKIFGGGNMLMDGPLIEGLDSDSRKPLGDKNSAEAFRLFMEHRISVKALHVGEFGYRRIVFNIETGDVWVKFTPVTGSQKRIKVLDGRV